MGASRSGPSELEALADEVRACNRCARLVAWRTAVSAPGAPRRREGPYAASGIPGFGDPAARLVVVGLAPAAHGANRTGRMFTGDRSGDFLVAALHRAGFADRPDSVSGDDGLVLERCWITAAVRCAPPENRPLPEERDACGSYLARELALLDHQRVLLALGAGAFEALGRIGALTPLEQGTPRPRFAHGLEYPLAATLSDSPARTLLCSYHPSQRNVFTGLLTPGMLDAVLGRARALCA